MDNIRFAGECDREDIKRLWNSVFGDGFEFIDRFIDSLDALKYALVLGKPIKAMLFMLPVKLCVPSDEEELDGRYIYAVATDEKYRGKGLASQLIKAAHSVTLQNHEHFCALVPANDELFNFYSRLGYEINGFGISINEFKAYSGINADYRINECGLDEFTAMREDFLKQYPYFKWNRDVIAYNYSEINRFNGKILKISSLKNSFYAVCFKEKNRLMIKELSFCGCCDINGILNALCCYFKVNSCEFITIGNDKNYSAVKVFSNKAKAVLKKGGAYLGLAMD